MAITATKRWMSSAGRVLTARGRTAAKQRSTTTIAWLAANTMVIALSGTMGTQVPLVQCVLMVTLSTSPPTNAQQSVTAVQLAVGTKSASPNHAKVDDVATQMLLDPFVAWRVMLRLVAVQCAMQQALHHLQTVALAKKATTR